jgi:hypothetical protein
MCGPYGAIAWAKARSLDIHYVDNCWVYVTVDRDDLEAFMLEVLEGRATPGASVIPGPKYLLMAEEF